MILFDKNELLKALNTEIDEYSELADVIKFIENFESSHSFIRSEGRPILIKGDRVAYLTDEHIEVLKEYEQKKMHEEVANRILDSMKRMATLEPPFKPIKVIDFDKPREEGEE